MAGRADQDRRRAGGYVSSPALAPLTSMIGRGRDLEDAVAALRRCRLVTLSGPGGVGKTRLATEVGRRQLRRRLDGVWLVDLAAGPKTPRVADETARVLGLRTGGDSEAVGALCRYLAHRDLLLVLDNCEHVVDECAALAAAVLTCCPQVRVLATSREPLGVPGETVRRLEPLGPEDARRLFLERTRRQRPEFVPDEETELTISELCARLDRLPLAIELAAARMSAMTAAEILAGVQERLDELRAVRRLSPPHHASVRAAVEWSHQLLDPAEQEAFRMLAVFVGSFDAAAGRSVAPGLSPEMVTRLVDKSILLAVPGPGGRTRYRMLQTVREYAHELLVTAGELETAARRHFRHFLALGDGNRDGWPSARAQALVDAFEADYGNVRAAVEWAAGADPCSAMRLLSGMLDLFFTFGQADGRRLTELVLERCGARDRHRADAQISAGVFEFLAADLQAARHTLEGARRLCAELDDPGLEGWARFFRGLLEVLGGDGERARDHLEAARRLHRGSGFRVGEARSTAALGLAQLLRDEPAQAQELVEQALSMATATDDRFGQGQCHTYLGLIAGSHGDTAAATSHFAAAVECLRPYRDGVLLPVALVGQAGVLVPDDPATALRIAAAASAVRDRVGGQFAPFYQAGADRVRSRAEARLGAEAGSVWVDGFHLGVDDAIALAFGRRRPRPASCGPLSEREGTVAGLVAQGLSNKEIARRLHLSVRTVESHVRQALTKVGLANRTQLAGWVRSRTE